MRARRALRGGLDGPQLALTGLALCARRGRTAFCRACCPRWLRWTGLRFAHGAGEPYIGKESIDMIRIICIGKMKDKALHMLEEEYIKRLKAFSKVEVVEVRDEPNERIEREKEAAIAKEKEGERALAQIKDSDLVILLDLHGSHWDSETFAKKLGEWQSTSSNLVFVIAGSLGPSPALTARANVRWKLSDLTFTHLMTRVLVLEQIYRGFMILGGRKYHK